MSFDWSYTFFVLCKTSAAWHQIDFQEFKLTNLLLLLKNSNHIYDIDKSWLVVALLETRNNVQSTTEQDMRPCWFRNTWRLPAPRKTWCLNTLSNHLNCYYGCKTMQKTLETKSICIWIYLPRFGYVKPHSYLYMVIIIIIIIYSCLSFYFYTAWLLKQNYKYNTMQIYNFELTLLSSKTTARLHGC